MLQQSCSISARGGDEIWVRDTVNTNFMEGVLPVVSTGFAPGSIYGLTPFYFHVYFAVCAILDLWYEAFFETLVKDLKGLQREHTSSQVVMPRKGRCSIVV